MANDDPQSNAESPQQPPAPDEVAEAPLASTDAAAAPAGPRQSRRQRQALRVDVLKRLDRLKYENLPLGKEFSLSEDLGTLVDLGADAILNPCVALVEKRQP